MNTELVKSQIREQKWREVIEGYQRSEMNVEQYCDYKGVSKSGFYKWLRKFREQKLEEAGIDENTFAIPAVIELEPKETIITQHSVIRISSKDITVEVESGVGTETLSTIVKALR